MRPSLPHAGMRFVAAKTRQLSSSLLALRLRNCVSLASLPESTGQLSALETLGIDLRAGRDKEAARDQDDVWNNAEAR
jgi:hypothetical protein